MKSATVPVLLSVLLPFSGCTSDHAPLPGGRPGSEGPAIEQRIEDLLAQMTYTEKVSQLLDNASAITRLGIPAYGWWNEALHGVARAGVATVFPQAIGLAATWDEPLLYDEDRAAFVVEPGEFEIQVGASSGDIRLKDLVTWR